MLKELLSIASANQLGAAIAVKIKFMIVAGMFEYNTKILDCVKYSTWQESVPRRDEKTRTQQRQLLSRDAECASL